MEFLALIKQVEQSIIIKRKTFVFLLLEGAINLKLVRYYYNFLFKNTKYLKLCICMLIASMIFYIVFIPSVDTIESSFMPFVDMFPFFLNPTSRIYFVLFINIMPLITSLPVADIVRLEKNCQYHLFTRQNKKISILSKAFVSFFCGFSLFFLVLASSLLFSYIILGQGNQDFFYYTNFFIPNNEHIMSLTIPFYNLLLSNTCIFSIIYIFLLSILGGILSLMTFSVGINCKSLLITYCFSFIVIFLGNTLTLIIPGIIDVFDPLYSLGNNLMYIVIYMVIFLLMIIVGLSMFLKKDVC